METVIVDTTVMLNILNVPRHNRERTEIMAALRDSTVGGAVFLLPLAAVFQTGNHIADLRDDGERRRYAAALQYRVRAALDKREGWAMTPLPDADRVKQWMTAFPQFVQRGAGYDVNGLSIVQAWEAACRRVSGQRVRIWSLNRRLQDYDRAP